MEDVGRQASRFLDSFALTSVGGRFLDEIDHGDNAFPATDFRARVPALQVTVKNTQRACSRIAASATLRHACVGCNAWPKHARLSGTLTANGFIPSARASFQRNAGLFAIAREGCLSGLQRWSCNCQAISLYF